MTKREKLIKRFLAMPSDFHFNEMVRLPGYFGFREVKKGKTSGSRISFINGDEVVLSMHKPHLTGILKHYQLKQV